MTYDFAILGGGSAGYAAAQTGVDLGLRTVVIDGAEELGGLCILKGCMPSKAIIASANRHLSVRRAREFGLRAEKTEVKPEEIVERKRRLIDDFAGYRQGQLQDGRFDLIRGRGRFLSANRLAVRMLDGGEAEVEARSVFIATGSRISVPAIPGLAEAGYLTSDDVLDLETLPRSVTVLGGGAIALEMAHYLEALGVRVTLIQRSDQVLKEADEDCARVVEDAFRKRGMEVYTGTQLLEVERLPEGKKVTFEWGGQGKVEVVSEEILAALGRTAVVDDLGLEELGIELEKGRIRTDDRQATTCPGIYAGGDVSGPLEVVHLAVLQGETGASNAARFLGWDRVPEKRMDYRMKLFGVFSEPQVALVGKTERELQEEGVAYRVASYPFSDHGKSMVLGETEGFVKLMADAASGEILGGAVVGPSAVDLIHEVVVAMRFRARAQQLAEAPHYHPSLAEIWTYPAEELAEGDEN